MFLLLFFVTGFLIFIRTPVSFYNSIITFLSDFLITNFKTNGSLIKIDSGLHSLSKISLILIFAFFCFLIFWKFLLKELPNQTDAIETKTHFTLKLKKQDWFIMAALTIAGALLRVFPLNQSLWQDEIGVYNTFIEPGILATIFPKSAMGSHPLMQIIVTLFTNVVGVNEITLRLPVFIFAVATIPLLYYVSIKISGQRTIAVVAAVLVTINSYHIYYSFQMRGYAILIFFCILSIYFFIELLYSSNKNISLLYILSNVMLVYTHMLTVYVVIAQQIVLISWLLYNLRNKNSHNFFPVINISKYLKSFIITMVLIFIVYVPQLPIILMNVLSESNTFISPATYFNQVLGTSHNIIAYTNYPDLTRTYAIVIAILFILSIKKNSAYLIVFYTSVVVFFITAFAFNVNGFFPRYIVCNMPFFVIINAVVICELWQSSKTGYKLLSVAIAFSFLILSFSSYPKTYRYIQNYKGAVEFVNNQNKDESAIIVANSLGKVEIRYYDKKIIPLYSKPQLDSVMLLNKKVYAITTYERFVDRGVFLNDKATQNEIQKKFKLLKSFEGEEPVHVWQFQQ
jgi:hypothetical protein